MASYTPKASSSTKGKTPCLISPPELLGGVYTVEAQAVRAVLEEGPMYRAKAPKREEFRLKLVPYYAWANREDGEMRVFFPEIPAES